MARHLYRWSRHEASAAREEMRFSQGVLSPSAFGGKLKNPLRVVLVATHADIMNIPRPAGGEFGYDKDTSLLKEIRNR